MLDLTLLFNFISHVLPIVITLGGGSIFWIVKAYLPQLHYIDLVTKAVDDQGAINLAKYMAKRNGGKHINTDVLWESFVPAAKAIAYRYQQKID